MAIGTSGVGGGRAAPPPTDSLKLMIEFFNNRERVLEDIARWEKAKSEHDAALEALNLGGEVRQLHDAAKADREEATKVLREAQKEADRLVTEAKEAITAARTAWASERREEDRLAKQKADDLDRRETNINARDKVLKEDETKFAERKAEFEKEEAAFNLSKAAFEARVRRLNEAWRS